MTECDDEALCFLCSEFSICRTSTNKRYFERNGKKLSKKMDAELKHYLSRELKSFDLMCNSLCPPLWSSGQSFWLQIQRSRFRFPALPDFLSSSGSGTGSTQPREVN